MDIRLLQPSDAENYRKIRLEALQKDPEAFASSYEEEKDYTIEIYKTRLESNQSYTFGAFQNE